MNCSPCQDYFYWIIREFLIRQVNRIYASSYSTLNYVCKDAEENWMRLLFLLPVSSASSKQIRERIFLFLFSDYSLKDKLIMCLIFRSFSKFNRLKMSSAYRNFIKGIFFILNFLIVTIKCQIFCGFLKINSRIPTC